VNVKERSVGILSLLVLTGVLAPSLRAQSLASGDIMGTVSDQTGAVVAAATVRLQSATTGEILRTTTNASGVYRFAFVPPANYTISVQAEGFATVEDTVTCTIGQAKISDFNLRVGSTTEIVEVASTAAVVDNDNADLSTSFGSHLIQSLPNAGNDLTYIAQTAPGVNMNSAGGLGNFQAYGLPSVSNLFTVNAANAMDPYVNTNISGASNLMLGRNDLQEVTISTNAYAGQFGQQAGVQVNYVTKSGTNQFHGNAVYWWTGRAMDANDWFNNRTVPRTPRPFANNNQWAGSLGGPIKKNKLFFFVDNEGITYVVPSATAVFSPSPQFATATLDNLAIVSPASVPQYSKMFHLYQNAVGYNAATPVPGGGCLDFTPSFKGPCFVQYQANPAEPGTEWMQVGRVDVNFSEIDRIFVRVSVDHGTQATYADPINTAFNATSYQPIYNGQAQWTHVFNSNATNSFVIAGSYYSFIFTQNNAAATFPVSVDMSALGYTSMANFESSFPSGRNGTQYQFIDDYSLTKGSHSMKFGVNWRRYDASDYDVAVGTNPQAHVTSVTQFFNGQSQTYIQNFPSTNVEPIALWGMGLYAQDEWRVKRNLTLTLGLRAEKNSNPVCQTNCAAIFNGPFYSQSRDPSTPYNEMIVSNRHQVFPATDSINWAPRFGFAWSPESSGRTVLRAGIGIFYDALAAGVVSTALTNLPNVVAMRLCCGEYWADAGQTGAAASAANSAAAIEQGFVNGASFHSLSHTVANFSPPTFYNYSGTFNTPQYQEWSFQIEQQVDNSSSLSLAYVGNHGIHTLIRSTPNASASGLANIPTVPYNRSFGAVFENYTAGISNYNGLTASYRRRLSYGFDMQASYAWGHALDDVSNGGWFQYNINDNKPFTTQPFCLRCRYSNADYDIRNSFNAAYVWTLPFSFDHNLVRQVLGGWTISQNFFSHSGLPFTVFDSTTFVRYFGAAPAAVISNGQMSCQNGNSQCLNPADFESATAYDSLPGGTRNLFRGPAFFDSDLSANKSVKLTERCALQIGANLYNVFNHPNFANPNPNLSNVNSAGIGEPGGNFGMITRTTVPPTTPYGSFFAGSPSGRIVQLQGKIIF
jgi:hypothetical protein